MLKISILTPIYGVEKYIEQCARSLFEQSYASIEYIFVAVSYKHIRAHETDS